MSSDFVCLLCLWLNAETFTCQRPIKKNSIFPLPYQKKKKFLPRKMSISFEGELLLTQESHGPQIGPISKGCLNSSRCDQPRACSSIRQDAVLLQSSWCLSVKVGSVMLWRIPIQQSSD